MNNQLEIFSEVFAACPEPWFLLRGDQVEMANVAAGKLLDVSPQSMEGQPLARYCCSAENQPGVDGGNIALLSYLREEITPENLPTGDQKLASDYRHFHLFLPLGFSEEHYYRASVSRLVREDQVWHCLRLEDRTEERKRRKQLERLDLAIDSSRDGLWDLNLVTGEAYFSRRWKEMLGYGEEEIESGMPDFLELMHPEDREEHMRRHEEHLAGKTEFITSTVRLRHRDGTYRWMYGKGKAYFNEAGQPVRMAGFQTDISELKRHERELARARARAEKISQAKTRLIRNLSHEIRTPLNSILGYAQILENTELPAGARKQVRPIRESGEHILNLVGDLVDLSRLETGNMKLEEERFDLRTTLRAIVDLFQVETDRKKLELTLEVDSRINQPLRGDRGRLSQILINLVSNAVKFTGEGRITLGARVTGGGDFAREIEFEVVDTGMGIEPEIRQKIFDDYQQGTGVYERFGGSGLGLAISRHLAELMGGILSVESEPGKGSRFFFTLKLPVAR